VTTDLHAFTLGRLDRLEIVMRWNIYNFDLRERTVGARRDYPEEGLNHKKLKEHMQTSILL